MRIVKDGGYTEHLNDQNDIVKVEYWDNNGDRFAIAVGDLCYAPLADLNQNLTVYDVKVRILSRVTYLYRMDYVRVAVVRAIGRNDLEGFRVAIQHLKPVSDPIAALALLEHGHD